MCLPFGYRWLPLPPFPPAPVYLCVYLSLLKSLPAANFPGSSPAHQRETGRDWVGDSRRGSMFQPTPKRCFTIESLVAKDSPLPASRSEDPIRPAALSYANSSPMNPFLNGFHSTGRGVYSNPDLVFAEAVSHPPNPAVPVHPVPPPHALAAHPLPASHSTHPLFASQQRDPSTFYPWLIHRYRYLGHRFQGTCNFSSPSNPRLHPPAGPGRSPRCGCWGTAGGRAAPAWSRGLGSAGPAVFCPCFPLRQTWKSCQSRGAWAWFCFAAFPGLFWFPGKWGASGKARPAGTSSAFCPH